MKTTFLNGDAELKTRGEQYLNSRASDFKAFMNAEDLETVEIDGENQNFYEYGLSFDYCAAYTFNDQTQGYYRYQFSWGGPSDELRFYQDGRIEYVFLDWGTGVGFDVTGEDWAEWAKDWFEDIGSIDWNKAAEEDSDAYMEHLEANPEEAEEEEENEDTED